MIFFYKESKSIRFVFFLGGGWNGRVSMARGYCG